MKLGRANLSFLMAAGLIASACSDNAPAPLKVDYNQTAVQPAKNPSKAPAQQGASGAKVANAAAAAPQYVAPPAPPADAQWTLYCKSINGPGHVERATMIKNQLRETTKMPGWYLIHNEGESVLYYGYYRSFNDPKDARESARAQADRKAITSLQDAGGDRPFQLCIFVGLNSPDPSAPAEWNLANARGTYTLEIGAYTGSSERKTFAVNAVREARQNGIEAYYYHGDTVSSVCVGAWADDAIRVQGDVAKTGNTDSDPPILVAPANIPSYAIRNMRDKDDRAMKVVQEKMEIVDPSLRAMQAKFPQHNVNGEEEFKVAEVPGQKQKMRIPVPSMIVPIPKPAPSILNNGGELVADPFGGASTRSPLLGSDSGPQQLPPRNRPAPVQPGAGKLKSVGQ